MKQLFLAVLLFSGLSLSAQLQVCPLNNNWATGDLTHWEAYTGNNSAGNGPNSIKLVYDSTIAAPTGTIGNNTIYEYNLGSVPGIQILTASTTDPYGGFATVPRINGYQYTNSILLGSTSITRSSSSGTGGGYVRGVRYRINVPAGPATEPYTMTYAYAMILENGTHNSNQQPLFQATLEGSNGVITCASPKYFLPTHDNADSRGTGAILDTAVAKSQGFYLARLPSPNANPNGGTNAGHLMDVWAKDWTEVTFDLSAYRGQQVVLTFETDNCVPGGHFAYSYVALRNVCAGLEISGFPTACTGSTATYSIPGLTGATYNWTVPADWQIVGSQDSSVLKVQVGNAGGYVIAHETNSCADLTDTLAVTTTTPTVAGAVTKDAEVCSGSNSSLLTLNGNRGSVLNWLMSVDNGVTWTTLSDTTTQITATNLTATTQYRALVQHGISCTIDTSRGATILVDPLSVGGKLDPPNMEFCIGQNKGALLTLSGNVGTPVNWQSSPDGITWTGFAPVYRDSLYSLLGLSVSTQYRVIVQSGVCPADTSFKSNISFVTTAFPEAAVHPVDTAICYNTKATLTAAISTGSNYNWSNTNTLASYGNGSIAVTPLVLHPIASPRVTTDYVLTIENAGCPNLLIDTFHVKVLAPIIVDAGNDTSVVINQPLQLHASSNDTTSGGDTFAWTPIIGLDNPNIPDPVASFSLETDSIRYLVTATNKYGCIGTADILVRVFKTGPDIFVPSAFSPGGTTNTIFRPIPVGITTLNFFRVYNRWGQLVYSTTRMGDGWDGRFAGHPVNAGTFVWIVQGVTFTGKTVFHKGTMVLVR